MHAMYKFVWQCKCTELDQICNNTSIHFFNALDALIDEAEQLPV